MNDTHSIKGDFTSDVLREKIADVKSEANTNFSLTVPYLMVGGLAQMACEAKPHISDSSQSKLWKVFGDQPITLQGLKWIGYGFATIALLSGIAFKYKQKKFEKELDKHELQKTNISQFEVYKNEPQVNKFNTAISSVSTLSPTNTIHSNMVETTRLQETSVPLNRLG